jgi:hypothetical protein
MVLEKKVVTCGFHRHQHLQGAFIVCSLDDRLSVKLLLFPLHQKANIQAFL